MIEETIFKESIFINTYKGDSDLIQEHINHLITFDKGRHRSNKGGYQSHDITFGFHDLIHFAISSLASIGEEVKLENFWVNINEGNHYNSMHIHTFKGWSAVYYHKVCCEKAALYFHHLVPTIADNSSYLYTPKERSMVFFKSKQPHSVNPCFQENHQRISIAFNFC